MLQHLIEATVNHTQYSKERQFFMPTALHQMEKLQMSCSVGLDNAWLCNIVTELPVVAATHKKREMF